MTVSAFELKAVSVGDPEFLTRNVRRLFAGKENDRIGDLVSSGETAQWQCTFHYCLSLVIEHARVAETQEHTGLDHANQH